MSAVATPLALAPAKDTAPNGILTGKPMKVLRVTTLLTPLEQAFSHTNRPNILEYLEYFFAYFPLVLTTFVAYFELHLGGRIEAVEELRVPLGDLEIHYNWSSF